ncbi:MAG: hypothetical protein JW995_02280 [Melioribacteraceae bacterium]|nr:hypothetical protein [Melioribacteraceae bacterium]
MMNTSGHKFHIPVMGLGFTIDTPLKVAHYGIDSVVSIVDDDLIEKMREVHCKEAGLQFEAVSKKVNDYRAKRITAYLNLLDDLVKSNFDKLIVTYGESGGEFEKYIDLLPENSELKCKYRNTANLDSIKDWFIPRIKCGSIDVNIMTKIDKVNYNGCEKLPVIYNDAHAALRGYSNSKLKSSIVFSAGMNPRLYGYIGEFTDFYPDCNGELKKKIILKVSDYRSALIQGKFLAKKGLWVSEFRIESGLNCGGHAFATEGYLMGPILEEFKTNREELTETMHKIYTAALRNKNTNFSGIPFEQKITAQGGVGTYEEQNFLIDYYGVDSVGWGTPFLLVPEATNLDEKTLNLLSNAKEDDLYLSRISPLGVPFNSIKGSTKELEKSENALNGRPGSPCPKKFLQFNTELGEKPICTASRAYQSKKIDRLKSENNDSDSFSAEYKKIIEKACLCVGLATSALIKHSAATKTDGEGVLVCPGPNLAYFSSIVTLREMINHIYGRVNLVARNDRPNMFIKELKLYLDYLKEEISESDGIISSNQLKYFTTFKNNIAEGIEYYKDLFASMPHKPGRNYLREIAELEEDFVSIIKQFLLYNDSVENNDVLISNSLAV